MMMIRSKMHALNSFMLVFICCVIIVRCQIGEVCKTAKGSNGLCISILNCPSLLQQVKQKKFVKPCGFKGSSPFVCCETEESRTKTKQKCQEYKSMATPFVQRKHIIGGTRSKEQQFPHMVALGYEDVEGRTWMCGGSLISERYVLTAAHCVNTRSGPVKFARLGTINLKNPEQGGLYQDFNVIQIITHPDYKYPLKYNDIALLELDSNVTITKFVRPACLHTDFIINATNYIATGWGFLENGGNFSDELMDVNLVPYSFHDCRKTYKFDPNSLPRGILEESQICAGGSKGEERDTCNGDSGGPIQILSNKVYSIIGVTSFGKHCGLSNIPAVYTRVSNYISWIEDIVWP